MEYGFISLHRKILSWEWYSEPITARLFIHLLLRANHKKQIWRGVAIERGELLTGRKNLAEECGFSEMQIRTALDHLKSTQEITIKSTKKYSIIKLNNYNLYQQSNQQNNQEVTKKQPSDNQEVTTNNNVNNDNNENNVNKESGTNPKKTMEDFLEMISEKNETYESFVLSVSSQKNIEVEIVRRELDEFVKYWTEKNHSGTKQRWQMEKVFEVSRRLGTWFSRSHSFQKTPSFKNKPKEFVFIS